MGVDVDDDFVLLICHDGWSSSETGIATGWARVVQPGSQDGDSISGPDSYEDMLGWTTRWVRAFAPAD